MHQRPTIWSAGVLMSGLLATVVITRWASNADDEAILSLIAVAGLLLSVLGAWYVRSELIARHGLEERAAAEHDRASLLHSRFHAAVYRAPVGVAVFDLSGHVEVVNDPVYDILGIEPGTTSPQVLDYFRPDDQPMVLARIAALADGTVQRVEEELQVGAPGRPLRWVRISCSVIPGPDAAPVAVVAHVQDIEAERAAQEALRSRTRWFSSIVERSSDVIVLFGQEGLTTWASPSVEGLLGVSPVQLVGQPIRRFIHPEDRDLALGAMGEAIESGTARAEFRIFTPTGERWLETTFSNLLDDPDVASVITISRDVTERHLSTQQLAHQAAHDGLTGLFNRAEMEARLAELLLRMPHEPVAVAFLDLDRFKPINDDHGHLVGDELLKVVARVLEGEVRQQDHLCRPGGDEFVILLEGASMPTAIEVAERVRRRLCEPIRLPGVDDLVQVSASIGVAVARPDDTVTTLLHAADLALYEAKRRGRDRVEVSTRSLQEMGEEVDELLDGVARREVSAEVLPEEPEGPLPS